MYVIQLTFEILFYFSFTHIFWNAISCPLGRFIESSLNEWQFVEHTVLVQEARKGFVKYRMGSFIQNYWHLGFSGQWVSSFIWSAIL